MKPRLFTKPLAGCGYSLPPEPLVTVVYWYKTCDVTNNTKTLQWISCAI